MIKSLHKQLLTAGLLAGIGFGAIAQAPAAVTAPAQPQAQAQTQRGDPARMEQRHARHQQTRQVKMERRLAALKLKLQIGSAQEGAWNAWTSAMKPAQRVEHRRGDRAEFVRMTTPERLDRMRAIRAVRSAEMDKRADATKTFYAALSADQQKVFDGESLRMGGKRGHHGKGGHGHHHRGA